MTPLLKPKPLQAGQTIGLVAPASATRNPEDTRFAIDVVESLGFRVKVGQHLFDRHGYLAGQDRDRAADLNRMFADPEVDAIFTVRGGYGCMRMLPYLDYDLIRQHPKILLGYSDITALHHAIYTQTGLITFHGPVMAGNLTSYTLAEFKQLFFNPQPPLHLGVPPPFEATEGQAEYHNRLIRLVPGTARGRLIGGNLTLMSHLMGTPYQPDFKEAILILEDIGESVYRIDRLLTHLWLTGKLDQLAGIVFGKFTDCAPGGSWTSRFSLEEVLLERCQEIGLPALWGLMIGHVKDQTTFPIGCKAELDVDAETLTLLETPFHG
jgi:muramoyltetrapeptide carboxypeptidase